jgi:hypothetical protein
MSSLVIYGDTSGAITLTANAVAGTNTITVPAQTGTMVVGGPAFSASANATTSLTGSGTVKVLFGTKIFDTNNNFASSTFTPTVAGYYQFNTVVSTAAAVVQAVYFYKNGSALMRGAYTGSTAVQGSTLSGLIYMNGTTDYVEVYFYNGGATTTADGNTNTTFSGCFVRGA